MSWIKTLFGENAEHYHKDWVETRAACEKNIREVSQPIYAAAQEFLQTPEGETLYWSLAVTSTDQGLLQANPTQPFSYVFNFLAAKDKVFAEKYQSFLQAEVDLEKRRAAKIKQYGLKGVTGFCASMGLF